MRGSAAQSQTPLSLGPVTPSREDGATSQNCSPQGEPARSPGFSLSGFLLCRLLGCQKPSCSLPSSLPALSPWALTDSPESWGKGKGCFFPHLRTWGFPLSPGKVWWKSTGLGVRSRGSGTNNPGDSPGPGTSMFPLWTQEPHLECRKNHLCSSPLSGPIGSALGGKSKS